MSMVTDNVLPYFLHNILCEWYTRVVLLFKPTDCLFSEQRRTSGAIWTLLSRLMVLVEQFMASYQGRTVFRHPVERRGLETLKTIPREIN